MVAVQVGGSSDLKNIIQQSGMKLNMTDMNPGEPNDETFVKQVRIVLLDNGIITSFHQSIIYLIIVSKISIYVQAKYHIKKYKYEKALYYVGVALEFNPESLVRIKNKYNKFYVIKISK